MKIRRVVEKGKEKCKRWQERYIPGSLSKIGRVDAREPPSGTRETAQFDSGWACLFRGGVRASRNGTARRLDLSRVIGQPSIHFRFHNRLASKSDHVLRRSFSSCHPSKIVNHKLRKD